MNPIIEVKNLSKKYSIRHQKGGYITIREIISNVLKNPFKFTKSKIDHVIGKNVKEDFWALKDVNFTVNKGDVVGIIGSNGAGKSTLLKILSQITFPTQGEIIMRGKITSLLEVGTGFHPELTGRENIFLNGAILGMGKKDIQNKFDQIVEFANIRKFLDTPVKYYSSGMYVRLAFSVAAHMEPDILLIDEVLAVGDAEFQKKCLGKIEESSKNSDRTVLFVSHNMSAIKNICKKCILLEDGQISLVGETDFVIEKYLSSHKQTQKSTYNFEKQDTPANISKVSVLNKEGLPQSEIPISENFSIEINFECLKEVNNAVMAILIYSQDMDLLLYSTNADISGKYDNYAIGNYKISAKIPASVLNIGNYTFDVMLCTPNIGVFGEQRNLAFEITNFNNPRSVNFRGKHAGRIAVPLEYQVNKLDN